jgi:chaperone required for assembly of F1-ATPase
VRKTSRTRPRKRFYKEVGVGEADGGFTVTLDGKPIKTPSGKVVLVPKRAIADAIAAEWAAQGETIDPLTMPMTRFANSVVQSVVERTELVADDVAKYLGSDLLFYRAGHPEALVAKEAAHWDPIVFWAAETLGAHFMLAEGINHVRQPDAAIAAARAAFPGDPWSIAALHVVTTLTVLRCWHWRWPMTCAIPWRSGPPPMSTRISISSNGAGRGGRCPPRRPVVDFEAATRILNAMKG